MGSTIVDVLTNLANQTGFASLDWKNYVMILIAFAFMYLAIGKGFEPLLLVPISFGMFLVNMFPDIMAEGGLLHYFYLLDEWSILPSLIFMGVGAMTDFGPLIANRRVSCSALQLSSVSIQLTSLHSLWDSTAKRLRLYRSSVVQMVLHLSTLPVSSAWVEHFSDL